MTVKYSNKSQNPFENLNSGFLNNSNVSSASLRINSSQLTFKLSENITIQAKNVTGSNLKANSLISEQSQINDLSATVQLNSSDDLPRQVNINKVLVEGTFQAGDMYVTMKLNNLNLINVTNNLQTQNVDVKNFTVNVDGNVNETYINNLEQCALLSNGQLNATKTITANSFYSYENSTWQDLVLNSRNNSISCNMNINETTTINAKDSSITNLTVQNFIGNQNIQIQYQKNNRDFEIQNEGQIQNISTYQFTSTTDDINNVNIKNISTRYLNIKAEKQNTQFGQIDTTQDPELQLPKTNITSASADQTQQNYIQFSNDVEAGNDVTISFTQMNGNRTSSDEASFSGTLNVSEANITNINGNDLETKGDLQIRNLYFGIENDTSEGSTSQFNTTTFEAETIDSNYLSIGGVKIYNKEITFKGQDLVTIIDGGKIDTISDSSSASPQQSQEGQQKYGTDYMCSYNCYTKGQMTKDACSMFIED